MPRTPASSSTTNINGYAVRVIRKGMGLTPQALAETIGKNRTYIVKIETGAVSRVGDDTFNALVDALKVEDRRALMAWPHEAAA